MNSLKDYIDGYFSFRGYKTPNAIDALLFLISEVGELAEAHLAEFGASGSTRLMLLVMVQVGQWADRLVSGRSAWVRNLDRKKAPSVKFEIGDVQSMLERYAGQAGYGDPVGCMMDKFEDKGYRL